MSNKKYTKTFFGWPSGADTDYGCVRNEEVKVTIEQSWPFDEEQVNEMKQSLSDHFDCSIRTEEDLAEEQRYWEQQC